MASFCRRLTPGSRGRVHDAGSVAWGTRLALVDPVGLKSPARAALHRDMTWPTCGARRGEAVEAVARRRRPDSLVVRGGWDGIDRFSDGLRARGWRLTSLRPPGVAYSVCRREPPRRGGAGGHGA